MLFHIRPHNSFDSIRVVFIMASLVSQSNHWTIDVMITDWSFRCRSQWSLPQPTLLPTRLQCWPTVRKIISNVWRIWWKSQSKVMSSHASVTSILIQCADNVLTAVSVRSTLGLNTTATQRMTSNVSAIRDSLWPLISSANSARNANPVSVRLTIHSI